MSDHAWVLENLAAYLAGGLDSAERERFDQHTAGCEACAAALAAAREVDAALGGLFADTRPGPALEDRVIQALRTRTHGGGWRLPVPGWLAVAAAALLLLGGTGALTSLRIVRGDLPFPGTWRNALRSEIHQTDADLQGWVPDPARSDVGREYWTPHDDMRDLDQLAKESRERALNHLDLPSGTPKRPEAEYSSQGWGADWGEGNSKSRNQIFPSGQIVPTAKTPAISDGTANNIFIPSDRTPLTSADKTRANVPLGGMGMGMMGMGGGMMGMMGGMAGGSPQTSNPYTYDRHAPTGPAVPKPTEPAKTKEAEGHQRDYFQPDKLTDDSFKEPKGERFDKNNQAQGRGEAKGDGKGSDNGRGNQDKEKGAEKLPEKPPDKPQQQPSSRKIVRTGEVEYEVQSFDAAVATINRLVKAIKGGFVATVNSDKLANGKVRGSVVVRVPPDSLDQLILDLRANLGKTAELKNQRIVSLDITKQYTDLESRLRAARAMEERLLQIIKTGKGEIKDLLAVEKELGNWRTRIEEMEGELRYHANQVALSTLTITVYEKEIQAPFGVVERERIQMGLEVDDVDQALRAAQKAVRDAKGRITRSELKQHSAGQFSATLHFEVAPDAAGPLRDRLRQLGTVSRLDIDRLEETEGGSGKPADGQRTRSDSRFFVSFYNLTAVAPRETIQIKLACIDAEAAFKALLARVDKAAGRVVTSNLNSGPNDQPQGTIQFEVKSSLADAVLEDIKAAGEVMHMQSTESADAQGTTRKKRGFLVRLWALAAVAPRETDEIQVASPDVAAGYRALQEAVAKAKGRVLSAQLNEQDRRNITAVLDFDFRRSEEALLRAALASAGDIYTRKAIRAQDGQNVIDSKVRWQVRLINQASIPPRETYVFGIQVADVEQTAAMLSALAGERQGRTIKADVSRERSGRVTANLVYDVPLGKVHELLDRLRAAGDVRVQRSAKQPEVPDSPLALARLDVTLSNKDLSPSDEGLWPKIQGGLSFSFTALSWSLMFVIVGVCVLLPWVLALWAIVKLVQRLRRKANPAVPAA